MNTSRFLTLALGGLLAVTNLYWWRRERTAERALSVSQAVESDGPTVAEDQLTATTTDDAAAAAAATLDAPVEALPERVEALDEKVRDLNARVDDVRKQWTETWWEARTADGLRTDDPHVVSLTLSDGAQDDVLAFAKRGLEDPKAVTVAAGLDDASVAVAVGSDLTDVANAEELAAEIAASAGGGAGGDARLARGGADDSDALAEAVERVRSDLETTEPFA